jgi:predicted hydrolase (HD superfamily)
MAKNNFPNTSFMNLFKNIVYDKDVNPNLSLDIWDAYVISPFYKDQLRYFQLHKISAGDTWVSLARRYYNDERLWWIIPLFNDIEDPFLVMSPDLFRDNVQQVKVLQSQYLNSLLLQARQQKISEDRKSERVRGEIR